MSRSLVDIALLSFSLFLILQIAWAQSPYVIFGGNRAVVRTRIDPIVNNGTYGTHVHDVFGGSGFSINYDYDTQIQSNCTTLEVTEDFSNYWVPSFYYMDPNNGSYTLMKSTMNIYYLLRPGPNNDVIHPFPQGLRMLAGDNERGTYNASSPDDQAISYMCLDYNNNHDNDPAWAERPNFFEHQCPDGMRAQVFFPSCWDGQNLDSADHKSHMSYPIGAYNDGYCPDSHPVHLISLFYELFAPTGDFPYNGPGTWAFSNGDTVGYRYHGDFVMGWRDPSLLQAFIDSCPGAMGNVADCPALAAKVDTAAAAACEFGGLVVDEDVGLRGPIAVLPGCNGLWDGNGTRPACSGPDDPGFVAAIQALPAGWMDLGCIAEGTSGRALVNASFSGANMTKAVCAMMCGDALLPYAGLEFGNQCFCGDALVNGATLTTLPAEQCSSQCSANDFETCGGENKLELLHSPDPTPVSLPPSNSTGTPNGSPPPPTSSTSGTWVSGGCKRDSSSRGLTGYAFASDSMTPSICQDACAMHNFTVAGLEYGSECYCGNSFANGLGGTLSDSSCTMSCPGDASAKCGGSWALTTFIQPKLARRHLRRAHHHP